MIIRSFFLHNDDIIDPRLVASRLGCFSSRVIVAMYHVRTSPTTFPWDPAVWDLRYKPQFYHMPHRERLPASLSAGLSAPPPWRWTT